jgi:protein TonB
MPIQPRRESVYAPPARASHIMLALATYTLIFLGAYWAISSWRDTPEAVPGAPDAAADATSNAVPATANTDAPPNVPIDKIDVPHEVDNDVAVMRGDGCRPHYPSAAVRRHHEGKTVLKLLIDAAGATQRASIETSSGFDELDDAALRAAKCMKFEPRRRDGKAVETYAYVPIDFRLN